MARNLPAVPEPGTPVAAVRVAEIEKHVAATIASIDNVELLLDWCAQAAALAVYLRGKELQRPMLGAQRRVEARIGVLLGKHQGKKLPPHGEEVIADQQISDFRVLAHGFNGAKLTEDEWRKSRRALVSLIRQRLGLIPPTPPLPAGQFRLIVADPPWRLDTGPEVFNATGECGHDKLPYESMSVEDIAALDVASRAAPDSHLYLWTTSKYVEHAYDVARAWGFKPSVLLVWSKKPRGIGLGDAYRLTAEFILYARKGKLKELRICDRTVFDWSRGKHSQKPDGFFQLVESMTPAPEGASSRLELFARRKRNGWTVWGHEAPQQ